MDVMELTNVFNKRKLTAQKSFPSSPGAFFINGSVFSDFNVRHVRGHDIFYTTESRPPVFKTQNEIDRIQNAVNKAPQLGYDVPNQFAVDSARNMLYLLYGLGIKVDFINAHEDGGITLEFYHKKMLHLAVTFNDEEIILFKRQENTTYADNIETDYINLLADELA